MRRRARATIVTSVNPVRHEGNGEGPTYRGMDDPVRRAAGRECRLPGRLHPHCRRSDIRNAVSPLSVHRRSPACGRSRAFQDDVDGRLDRGANSGAGCRIQCPVIIRDCRQFAQCLDVVPDLHLSKRRNTASTSASLANSPRRACLSRCAMTVRYSGSIVSGGRSSVRGDPASLFTDL